VRLRFTHEAFLDVFGAYNALLWPCGGVPRFAVVIPVLWAAVGSSAALALGIRADLALLVAGALLALDVLVPSALGQRVGTVPRAHL
jgi:hypothetical protein